MTIKKIIFPIILSSTLLTTGVIASDLTNNTVEAASINDYPNPVKTPQPNYHWKNNCTWYVFNKRNEIKRYLPSTWTHAKNWLAEAKRDGYRTGKKPLRGAILQSTEGPYGHVAFVEKVNTNGSINISEYNYTNKLAYGTRTLSKAKAATFNYIY